VHLDDVGRAGIMVVALAAIVGAVIGALAGLRGTMLVGVFLGGIRGPHLRTPANGGNT
jgi:hypothetical protein